MKKITTATLAGLLLATLFMSSCKKDDETPQENCTNNTNWARNAHELVYWNEPIYIFADSLYINLEETATAGVFKNTTKYDDGSLYPTQSNYMQPCGNSIYQSATADMANRQEAWRIDGAVGESWSTTVTSTGGYSVTTTTNIAAKNVSVTVAAGSFSCIQLHSVSVSTQPGSSTVETEIYINNDAGPVKVLGTTAHYELARKNF